ncbi:MAG: hypothetical protein L0Y45_01730, partial [Woeseiaceae bacterium]|nr:hypothetical protein [Woeseiaceae bacterium]
MALKSSFVSCLVLAIFVLTSGSIHAQSELRKTFFKDVDAAREAAEAASASLFAPGSWANGMRDYKAAEDGLERGRNIEYVRDKAADSEQSFKAAKTAAELAKTV